MTITERDVLQHRASGSWRKLERIAAAMVADAQERAGAPFRPALGGGTRVMLAINHRISDDIDLFIRDPQWIGYLSPRLSSHAEDLVSTYEETAGSLKLRLAEGEIDFIVAMSLLGLPEESSPDSLFPLEPVGEVLAKKLFYRGWALTARDLFDWWAVETRCVQAMPSQQIARLLATKYAGISNALDAMLQSARAADLWNAVKAPDKPDFSSAVAWGKARVVEYQRIGK